MKIRRDDVILQVPFMTSSTKMLTSAEKNTPGSNYCANPIKDIWNKYQTEFGYKPIKIEWGA